MLEAALALAREGFHVFPCGAATHLGEHLKEPLIPKWRGGNGHLDATRDEATIRAWWGATPLANIGINCEASGLLVVDIDPRNNGLENARHWSSVLGELPETRAAKTGSAGLHLLYQAPTVKTRKHLGPNKDPLTHGIDLQRNAYIVAPPSLHPNGNRYEWVRLAPIVALPESWIKQAAREDEIKLDTINEFPVAEPDIIEAARADLLAHGPAITGQNGDTHTYRAAAILLGDWGLRVEEALPLLAEWNLRCQPPWSVGELLLKMRNADTYVSDGGRGEARFAFELGKKFAGGNNTGPFDASALSQGMMLHDTSNILAPGNALPPLASEIGAIERPPLRYYTTGIAQLDNRIDGGLSTRGVTIAVARTGGGKSGLVIGFGCNVIEKHEVPFLYGSTELDEEECFARLAAHKLKVSISEILKGRIDRSKARAAVEGLPFYVLGCDRMRRGAQGIMMLAESIKAITDKHGVPPVVAVDYLQMMADEDPKHVRMGVSSIANSLRVLGQALDCAMIAVSSTGRAFYRAPKEDADNPIAYLGAAKESGDVEFAAVNILFLDVNSEHVDGEYKSRIVVAKARRGEIGFVGARFHGPSGRWREDASVLGDMTGEARKRSADKRSMDEMKEKLVLIIKQRGPIQSSTSRKDQISLRTLLGQGKLLEDALAELLNENAIKGVEEHYADAAGKRQKRTVYSVDGAYSADALEKVAPQVVATLQAEAAARLIGKKG